ncbi:MAG TPA: mechanosensitive ion channel domain-containing protein [Chthoniobacterales bacterium]|jgi:small-conductance mechanosensitive channel
MDAFGIKFVGFNPENERKLPLTLAFILAVIVLRWILRGITRLFVRGDWKARRARFWTHQGISIVTAALMVLGVLSIWFDHPTRLTTALGLVSAGLAFALQKVITALAGYVVILRGKSFSVGDRITMGGVRGDVIALGFIQTTIMEMGQPPAVQSADPAMWVQSRQFTGRIVTVSNSQIFDEPVSNYTRDFPYVWEEIHIPITYQADRAAAEKILLEAAAEHALTPDILGKDAAHELQEHYQVAPIDLEPSVFYRITDNWLELTG